MGLNRKNIDLSDKCIEVISIEAVKQKTDFKNLTQDILEHLSENRLSFEKILLSINVKRALAKSKK